MAAGKTIQTSLVAERYAKSLFELAHEEHKEEPIAQELQGLLDLIQQDAAFAHFIQSPLYRKEEQVAFFSTLEKEKAGKGLDPLVANFLKVVARHGRLTLLPAIVGVYGNLLRESKGEERVEVVSAVPLTEAEENSLKSLLKEAYGKSMGLTNVVDPAILGGLIVRFGSCQIDTSLSTKLSSLKRALKEVG